MVDDFEVAKRKDEGRGKGKRPPGRRAGLMSLMPEPEEEISIHKARKPGSVSYPLHLSLFLPVYPSSFLLFRPSPPHFFLLEPYFLSLPISFFVLLTLFVMLCRRDTKRGEGGLKPFAFFYSSLFLSSSILPPPQKPTTYLQGSSCRLCSTTDGELFSFLRCGLWSAFRSLSPPAGSASCYN